MNNQQIEAFRLEFFFQLDKKPSYGVNQVKELYIIALNNVLLGNTQFDKVDAIPAKEKAIK
jgi:hypothetical protein